MREVKVHVDERGVPGRWMVYGDFTREQVEQIQDIVETELDPYKIEGIIKNYLETLC